MTFRPGDDVIYVPVHARGNVAHPDCETGVVTSTNDRFVFVRYGDEKISKATRADDLRRPEQGPTFVSQHGESDCYNACLASLTGIPLTAFPVWTPKDEDAGHQWNECNRVLYAHGWTAEQLWAPCIPAGYAIASGPSPRGDFEHSVIVCDGVMVFDPHPSGAGLAGKPTLYVLPIRLAVPHKEGTEHE